MRDGAPVRGSAEPLSLLLCQVVQRHLLATLQLGSQRAQRGRPKQALSFPPSVTLASVRVLLFMPRIVAQG